MGVRASTFFWCVTLANEANSMFRKMIAGALLALTAVTANAQATVDMRQSFPHIPQYTNIPLTAPSIRDFAIPGPGVLHIQLILSPYYRSMEPLRFRSKVPVDGVDMSEFKSRIPGAGPSIGSTSVPEVWVDGSPLEINSKVRFTKARPSLQVGLFPSVAYYGGGSREQLNNSVQVKLWFEPERPAPTLAVGPWATVVETHGTQRWVAEWTVLEDGVTFDATWRHEPSGRTGANTRFARLESFDGNTIVIDRFGLGRYTGTISADRRTITGTVSWVNATWQVNLRSPLSSGQVTSHSPVPSNRPATPADSTNGTVSTSDGGLAGRWLDGAERVTLSVNGSTVTGSYSFRNGRLHGTATDNRFSGVWWQSESDQRCTTAREGTYFWGRFTHTFDGNKLTGHWGYCDGPIDHAWNWRRER